MPAFVTFPASAASGAGLTSTPFTLDRAMRPFAVLIGSFTTAAGVSVAFSTTSGTGPYLTLQRPDGSGAALTIHSGTGNAAAVIEWPATPWGVLQLTQQQTSVVSAMLVSVLR